MLRVANSPGTVRGGAFHEVLSGSGLIYKDPLASASLMRETLSAQKDLL